MKIDNKRSAYWIKWRFEDLKQEISKLINQSQQEKSRLDGCLKREKVDTPLRCCEDKPADNIKDKQGDTDGK